MDRRGEAIVIGTVLLILTVLVSGGIVAYYTLQQTRSVDASCLEALNSIQFSDIGFTCRMVNEGLTSFSIKITDDYLEGFQLGVERAGTSDSYEVKAGSSHQNVCILDSAFGEPLSVPSGGDSRTYVVRGNSESVFIAPILIGGKGCYLEARKELHVENECINPDVESRLSACLTPDGNPGHCGDGVHDSGEACDDGNTFNDDGCSASCAVESCSLTTLRWDRLAAREGTLVNLIADIHTCASRTISFDIYEDDTTNPDTPSTLKPVDRTLPQGTTQLTQSWIAEWVDDRSQTETNTPEYYFTLGVDGTLVTSSTDRMNELAVTACGDGLIQSLEGESCDSTDLDGQTCSTISGASYTSGTLSCYARGTPNECSFDVRSCAGADPLCGNSYIEFGEQCDDGNSDNGDGCSVSCNVESGWTCGGGQPSVCTQCGNGVLNPGEQCDDGNSDNGDGCDASCRFEAATCGNSLLEFGELCDPPGSACGTQGGTENDQSGGISGNAVSGDAGGSGVCSLDCRACEPPPTPLFNSLGWGSTLAFTGDSVSISTSGSDVALLTVEIDVWEDDGVVGDDLMTLSPLTSSFDGAGSPLTLSYTAPWQCDGGEIFGLCLWGEPEYYLKARLPAVPGSDYESSSLLIVYERNPTCGNGIVQSPEQCDPPEGPCSAAYGSSCNYCAGSCTFATLQGPRCGDTILQPGFGEVCDGTSLGGQTCVSQGFVGGTLACGITCRNFDTSACQTQQCGNGVREGLEQCDGSDLAGMTCGSFGFSGGTLSCAGCSFDTSACTSAPICGNNIVELGEECDPPGSTRGCSISGGTDGGISGNAVSGGDPEPGEGGQTCDSTCHWNACVGA